MPLKLHVGYPDPQWLSSRDLEVWHRFEPDLEQELRQAEQPTTEFRIPFLWQETPLRMVGASLALERKLPAPWRDPEVPDYGPWVHYQNLVDEGGTPAFRSALNDPGGIYLHADEHQLRLEQAHLDCPELLSLAALDHEINAILAALPAGEITTMDMDSLLARVQLDPSNQDYALEVYSARMFQEAVRLALARDLPLWLEEVYDCKPADETMTSWDFQFYGFGEFTSAAVTGDGQTLEIDFSCYHYEVPIQYFRLWFEDEVEIASAVFVVAEVPPSDRSFLKLEFSNGVDLELWTVDFLKRIEPSYDGFGDFLPEYRATLEPWLRTAAERRRIESP